MAEQETTVPIDDKGMLSEIMAEQPEAEQPEPEAAEPKVDGTGRLHGEGGRYVSKQAKEAEAAPTQQQAETTEATPQTDDDKAAQVPSWRLREVREAREAAERRAEEAGRQSYAFQQQLQAMQREMAQLRQPKAEPVDFFADPEAAIAQQLSPIEERFAQLQSKLLLNSSRALAVATHGAQAVQEMETAITEAERQRHPELPALAAQMRASDDPVQVAMQWHQRVKLQREVGNDLNGYKAKLRAELLQDAGFRSEAMAAWTGQAQQAAAQPGTRPNVQLPPSLNKATGAGLSNSDQSDEADMSDRGLFRYAMANRR